jgi:hypothetical protein
MSDYLHIASDDDNDDSQSDLKEEFTKEDLTPGTLDNPKKFGLFDIKTKTWMGSTVAPLTFGKHIVAQISAQLLCERMEVPLGRIVVKPYIDARKKVEDIHLNVSFEDAWERLTKE